MPQPPRKSSQHDLWCPEPAEALTRAPTWVRRIGRTADGQSVTLAMVLEGEPRSRHEDRIRLHRQVLETMTEASGCALLDAGRGCGPGG